MDQFRARLRQVGLKVTQARLSVLALLGQSPAPLSHAELDAHWRNSLPQPCDRVTLYRVLDALVCAGLLTRAADSRGVLRFALADANPEHAHHCHFRCTGCGTLTCLNARTPPPPDLPEGFRLDNAGYDISGLCPSCSRASI